VRRAVLLEVLDRACQVVCEKICHITGEVLPYHDPEDRNVLGVGGQAVGGDYPAALAKVSRNVEDRVRPVPIAAKPPQRGGSRPEARCSVC